jgi:hypothetical protein
VLSDFNSPTVPTENGSKGMPNTFEVNALEAQRVHVNQVQMVKPRAAKSSFIDLTTPDKVSYNRGNGNLTSGAKLTRYFGDFLKSSSPV